MVKKKSTEVIFTWQEPSEAQITDRIMTWLRSQSGMAWKQHGSGFQSGFPDIFYLRYNNRKDSCDVWCFEVKRPGKQATALQANMLKRLTEQGCHCFVVTSKEQVKRIVEEFYTYTEKSGG